MPNVIKRRSESEDVAFDMSKPLTPRSEQTRAAYGSLEMSLQVSPGLCRGGRKCFKHHGHIGTHYPKD